MTGTGGFPSRLLSIILPIINIQAAVAQDLGDPDMLAWRDACQRDTASAYQDYLERFPTGRFSNDAFSAMVRKSLSDTEGAPSRGMSVDLY